MQQQFNLVDNGLLVQLFLNNYDVLFHSFYVGIVHAIAVNDRKHLYLKCLICLKNKSKLIMLLAEYKMTSFISSEYYVYTCRSTTAQYIKLDFTIHVQ